MNGLLLKLSLYSSVLNLIFTPFSEGIARIFGYITIIFFLVGVALPFLKSDRALLSKTIMTMICVIVMSFCVSIVPMAEKFSANLVDNILSLLSFVAFYIALSNTNKEKNGIVLEDVFLINYVLCAMIAVFAFGPFGFKYQVVDQYEGKVFTLGLGNPNGVSLIVMFAIVFLLVQFIRTEKIYVKIINIVVFLLMFYVLFLLSSRTVFFCALVIAVAFLFKMQKAFKWLSYIVVLIPVLMIILQLALLDVDNLTLEVLGKSILTGRPEMYAELLEEINASPITVLFGNLCKYPFHNHHNGILTLLASLGIGGVIMYIVFWSQQLAVLRNGCTTKIQKMAFVAIIAIIIHASSEAMGVVGTIPYSVFIVVIMEIAKGGMVGKDDRITEDGI